MNEAHVLVVDDSRDMRDLLQEVLEAAGYEVTPCASGARALEVMAARRPDLVITDLLMPGMSGFSFRAAMLRRPDLATIPVVILSAYWQRPGETLDAADALPKPVSIDRLLATVARLTERPAQPPETGQVIGATQLGALADPSAGAP
ncbi:MAG TPA: response regulator [Candidatus Limnocylindria bacterium]|nr:response regulator [Candidatus Limnocylindria bacterium]